jgi:hypothetical protein
MGKMMSGKTVMERRVIRRDGEKWKSPFLEEKQGVTGVEVRRIGRTRNFNEKKCFVSLNRDEFKEESKLV